MWQVKVNGEFVTLQTGGPVGPVNTQTLQLTNVPASWDGMQFRCRDTAGVVYEMVSEVYTIRLDTSLVIPQLSLDGNTLRVINPQTQPNYRWQASSDSTTGISIASATGNSFTADTSGYYRVEASLNLCKRVSAAVEVVVEETPSGSGLVAGPNPTTGLLKIDSLKISDNWQALEILDANGSRAMAPATITNRSSITIDVATLRPGVYLLMLRRKEGAARAIRFVKM